MVLMALRSPLMSYASFVRKPALKLSDPSRHPNVLIPCCHHGMVRPPGVRMELFTFQSNSPRQAHRCDQVQMLPPWHKALGLARVELVVEVLPHIVCKEVQRPQGVGEPTHDMDVILKIP